MTLLTRVIIPFITLVEVINSNYGSNFEGINYNCRVATEQTNDLSCEADTKVFVMSTPKAET